MNNGDQPPSFSTEGGAIERFDRPITLVANVRRWPPPSIVDAAIQLPHPSGRRRRLDERL
jgi:hypothetical protein